MGCVLAVDRPFGGLRAGEAVAVATAAAVPGACAELPTRFDDLHDSYFDLLAGMVG